MRASIARLFVAIFIAASASYLFAAPVTGVGDNLETLAVRASDKGDSLTVLAGRRPPGKDFGPCAEIVLITVPAAGGAGTFTRIPELDGVTDFNFNYAFSRYGDLYFVKTYGPGSVYIGRVRNGRARIVEVALPPALHYGTVRVTNISALDNGGLDLGVNGKGDGVLVTVDADLALKLIKPIPRSVEFQGVLRLRGYPDRFAVLHSTGSAWLFGGVIFTLDLRAPDLLAPLKRQRVIGMASQPRQSPDGKRIAMVTQIVFPGLVTAHLFNSSLAPVSSLITVIKPSYPGLVDILLSDTRLVALYDDGGKCYATVVDSIHGRRLARIAIAVERSSFCYKVHAVIVGTKMMHVTTRANYLGDGVNTSLTTHVMSL
ncbi:hypothetical protein [Massilia sp. CCM 8734]|uniref:hypothetical protein n=1 Tax=Massilia sp. CCM 8734 TaxID=2609283 RepID=UPI001421E0EA|nr:hypothetical protein [Massilia sp. CCM 8734]NHZ97546.1 hypothetical protein [Massilia sp. CCM 8734]